MTESAHRIAINALRVEFNVTEVPIELVYASPDNRTILFNALGKTFEFTAIANPSSFSKPKWNAKQLWKLTEKIHDDRNN